MLASKFNARHGLKPSSHRKVRRAFLRSKKRIVRYSLLTANVALLVAVIFFVTKPPATDGQISYNSATVQAASETAPGPLDQVSSADIAVHVARVTGLPESTSVVNHADSITAIESSAPADVSVVAKPQVVSAVLASKKDIQTYVVESGDTISSIAAKKGVSSDSIRWSNNLTGNSVAVGKRLVLPPNGVNGIVMTVKVGDTPASLAQRYSADEERITTFNDAEVRGLVVGEQILVPDGVVRAAVAPAYNYYSGGYAFGNAPIYGYNGYDLYQCTWWAATRRAQIGRPIPANFGNANTWASNARRAGFTVNNQPAFGAILYHKNIVHVAFVEGVNSDGSILVSDMNYGSWGSRSTQRTVSPSEFGQYLFIH